MKLILLVDDDLFIRDLVATKLTSHDYSITTAATAREGLTALQKAKPDLVLLDLQLPDMSGVEVLKRIKTGTETASVPVVIFSNNDEPEIVEQVEAAGADDFFVKVTMNIDELTQALKKYL